MNAGKRLVLGVLVFLAVTATIGCGGEDAGLKIALDIEDEGRYEELFTYFTAETGIAIAATYGQDLSKLIGTKDEPDIIKTSTVMIRTMAASFIDLTPYLEAQSDIDTDDYVDVLMNALTIDGKVYALPTSINTSLLYYNKTIFDDNASELREAFGLGLEASVYPASDWTWDDYRTAGVILSDYTLSGDERTYTRFGAETQLRWWGEWYVYVRQLDGTFYEPGTDDHVCALDSTEALAATTFFRTKSMGSADEKFAPDASEAVSGFSFVSGTVAMIFGGHMGDWYSFDALGLDWGIQVLPKPAGHPDAKGGEISADAFGISVRSDKAADAFLFLKTWAGTAGALQMYKYGKIGALKDMQTLIDSVPEAERLHVDTDVVFAAIAESMTLPAEKDFSKVMREMVMAELYLLMYEGRGSETDIVAVLARIKTDVDDYYEGLYH